MTTSPLKIDQTMSDIEQARYVLETEAHALHNMAKKLDDQFDEAVKLCLHVKGRIVVTGIGKMGHIGAKAAATFASTGAPSFFVHPAEASHGDLGMITQDDVVLALSNSGESKELSDIITYVGRFAVPLIAVTAKPDSTLGQAADVVLNTHVSEEACPINKAPTSSTTATLAMVDALAVVLMKQREFKAEDFATFHPGGKLGAHLLKVGDIMAKEEHVPLSTPDALMSDVILEMTEKNLGCVGIVGEDGTLAGIITDGDLKRHMGPNFLEVRAEEVMSQEPLTIRANNFASYAVNYMENNEKNAVVTALFVVNDEQRPVGVLQLQHCLQAGVV